MIYDLLFILKTIIDEKQFKKTGNIIIQSYYLSHFHYNYCCLLCYVI